MVPETADEGSLEGGVPFFVTARGDTAVGLPFFEPVSLLANLRKGDIDPESDIFPELDILDIREAFGGVARYPFFVEVVPEVVDS